LFVSDRIWDSLEEDKIEEVRGVFSLSDYRCLHQRSDAPTGAVFTDQRDLVSTTDLALME